MAGKAVVLLSGGLDSSVALACAGRDGYDLYALTFDYGQRHRVELEFAGKTARAQGVREHRIFDLDLASWGGSTLTGGEPVPGSNLRNGIPPTYVPGRNTIFLSLGFAWAEVLQAGKVYIGTNEIDYSGYPDCRPEFLDAFEKAATLGTKIGNEGRPVKIASPLSGMKKADIVRLGRELGVDFSNTLSCYDPGEQGTHCGRCDSCSFRRRGFIEAGVADPTRYSTII